MPSNEKTRGVGNVQISSGVSINPVPLSQRCPIILAPVDMKAESNFLNLSAASIDVR